MVPPSRNGSDFVSDNSVFIEEITAALEARDGSYWQSGEVWFRCCTHNDNTPSAKWRPDTGTWYCFVCCPEGVKAGALEIAKLIGVQLPERKQGNGRAKTAVAPVRRSVSVPKSEPKTEKKKGTPSGPRIEYRYFDRDGKGGHVHVRSVWRQDFIEPDVKKSVTQSRPNPKSFANWKEAYDMEGVPSPLYNLKIMDEHPGEIVWFVEGEKCADKLTELGLVAVTSVGGTGNWLPEFASALAGRNVVIIPDNDAVGRKYARAVAAAAIPIANTVRRHDLSGLGKGEDVYDWLERGGDLADMIRKAAARPILELPPTPVDHTRVWVLSDLLDNPPIAPKSLVGDGILYPGGFAMLAGQPGYGKSWLSFDLALSTSLGDDWIGHRAFNCPRSLRTGMISMEMPIHFMAQRFQSLLQSKGLNKSASMDALSSGPYLLASPPAADVNLSHPKGLNFIYDFIETQELDLLIMDPFSRFHWIDENDAEAMGKVLAEIDTLRLETGCAILLVHHTRKPSAGSKGEEELSSVRGSSRLLSDPQTIFMVTRKGQQPILRLVKANFAPPMDDVPLERLPHGGFAVGVKRITNAGEGRLWILDLLRFNPGGLALNDFLASDTLIPKTTLNRYLKKMVEDGAIYASDGPPIRYHISEPGL